ncbi:MAG: hypothetical protein COV99_07475 [Bacteroidetes bacterium CG12_big_fil_rev_8_21_14_0_65_60_17]|nr:MAG: hypothetical protein COV99_07475 [Bacteroidetes bacterium CG12_big_fil_rev_8_21_14_0_65_60_17]
MKRILFLAGLVVAAATLFLTSTSALAQDAGKSTVHQIASEALSGSRTVTVQVPDSYAAYASTRFPVLYLLDGETNLAHAGPVVDFLADNGRIPEMIIVAVHAGATRAQDFTPPVEGQEGAGAGSAAYLAFLEDELVPFIEDRYRTAPLRLLSGHSMGGLFATWAMASESHLMDAWLAQSPYLVDGAGPGVVDALAAGVTATGSATDTPYYYANLGDEPDLEAGFGLLEKHLGTLEPAAIDWTLERMPAESHMSTSLKGLYNGLTGYFVDLWPMAAAALEEGGVEGLSAHIAGLSEHYGYDVLFSEQPFQDVTQRFMMQRDMASAREAAALYVEHHDPSVVAHFLHGVTLASTGAAADGLKEIERAIALYEAAPDPALAPVYGQLKQLRQQLGGGQ